MIKDNEEEDLEYARTSYLNLLGRSNEAIDLMMDLLRESEHARIGEVTANLIRSTADITDKLVDLHKSNKVLQTATSANKELEGSTATTTTNNNVFIGSTDELQKLLKKEKPIENIEQNEEEKDNE